MGAEVVWVVVLTEDGRDGSCKQVLGHDKLLFVFSLETFATNLRTQS
jgi:hypothetical protein